MDALKVLDDPEVKKRIKAVMGNKDTKFWDCTQLVDEPKISGEDYATTSGVRGLYTIMESVFDLNLATGKCCVGYLDDKDLYIYGAVSMKEVPGPVKDYINDLNKRKYGDLNVHFEKPDRTPIVDKKRVAYHVNPPKKNLNLTSVTGTYERQDTTRFDPGTLEVLALPDGKIKFDLTAASGGNTGEAQGVAALVGNRAIYQRDKGRIELQFAGANADVSGDDEDFCGSGVSLRGKYKKTDDQPPKFDF
jgi:hypothetical protein